MCFLEELLSHSVCNNNVIMMFLNNDHIEALLVFTVFVVTLLLPAEDKMSYLDAGENFHLQIQHIDFNPKGSILSDMIIDDNYCWLQHPPVLVCNCSFHVILD